MAKLFYIFVIVALFMIHISMATINQDISNDRFKLSGGPCSAKCCKNPFSNCGVCKRAPGHKSISCGYGRVCVCKK
uniref:Uncharacterized protein n=1 Tax=Panagrolaimus sp. ES5 TaxID=591445 RepID=A0AC34FJX4_9BILA